MIPFDYEGRFAVVLLVLQECRENAKETLHRARMCEKWIA